MKTFWLNLSKNKRNGQLTTSIPKNKLGKILREKLPNIKRMKITLEDFEEW